MIHITYVSTKSRVFIALWVFGKIFTTPSLIPNNYQNGLKQTGFHGCGSRKMGQLLIRLLLYWCLKSVPENCVKMSTCHFPPNPNPIFSPAHK